MTLPIFWYLKTIIQTVIAALNGIILVHILEDSGKIGPETLHIHNIYGQFTPRDCECNGDVCKLPSYR